MNVLTKHPTECNDEIPFGLPPGDESHGCTGGFSDGDCDPIDQGSDAPQEQDDEVPTAMSLQSTLREHADRISRETGGEATVYALVGSSLPTMYMVWLTVAGQLFKGEGRELADAELMARLAATPAYVKAKAAAVASTGERAVARG